MAKETKGRPLSLDDYDFGSEFDFDEFDLQPKPVKTKREAVERIANAALEGAIDTVKSPSFFREMIRKALPRGYGDMVDIVDKSATSVRELYNDGAKEMKPALRDTARVIDKMLPSASKYLPKSAENVLKRFADAHRETASQVGPQTGSPTDMAVAGLLQDTFRYNAADTARRDARNEARQGVQDAIANDRHQETSTQLEGIRKSVVSMAAYQKRIEFRFQQKMLELQARSYFVQADLLNEQRKSNTRQAEQLAAIMNNTALPDILKMKASEKFMDMLRNKAFSGLQDGVFGQRANFMQNLGKAFRDQAMGSIRNFSQGLRDGITGLESAQDSTRMAEEMGMDRWRLLGGAIGGQGAQWLGGLGAGRLGRQIQGDNGRRGRLSQLIRGVRRAGNRLQFGAENLPQIAGDFSNSARGAEDYMESMLRRMLGDRMSDETRQNLAGAAGFVGNPLLDLLRGTIRRANAQDTNVKSTGVEDLHRPTAWNNHAQKSVVEVIPGLLARILQEQQIARTGDTSIDLVQYDFGKGKFSATKALRRNLFNNLFDQSSRDGVRREQDRLLEMVDPNGKLNPVQRAELGRILLNDNMRGRAGYETGRISNYTAAHNFAGSENAQAFADLFKDLRQRSQADGEHRLDLDFSSRFREVGRSASDRRDMIQRLLEAYPRDTLEDMGLLKPGSSQIDMQQVMNYFGGQSYQANGVLAQGGLRQLGGGGSNRLVISNRQMRDMLRIQQGGAGPALPGPVPGTGEPTVNPVLEEIKRLITVVENQNTLPVTTEIKEILLTLQAQPPGPQGPSQLDRLAQLAGSAGQAGTDAAKRAARIARIRAKLLLRNNRTTINNVRERGEALWGDLQTRGRDVLTQGQNWWEGGRAGRDELLAQVQGGSENIRELLQARGEEFMGDAGRISRRVQRRAMVEAERLRRASRGPLEQLPSQISGYAGNQMERGRQLWGQRPSLEQLREMLRERLAEVRGQAGGAYGDLRDRARSTGGSLWRGLQRGVEEAREVGSGSKTDSLLAEIKEILTGMHARLEDGLMVMNMPEGGMPPGLLRRTVAGARSGLGRLNMRLSDVAKGMFNLTRGTAALGGRLVNNMVSGGIKTAWKLGSGAAGLVGDAATFAMSSQYRRARGFIDIYVGAERKPRMYGRLMQEGNTYFNQATGEPIRRLKDITGTVVKRVDGVEEVVLEADELPMAYQRMGPIKKSLKALGVVAKGAYGIGKKVANAVTAGIPPVFRMAFGVAKAAWRLLDMAQDVFVRDQLDSPALTARLMRAGGYRSAVTGDIIKRPSQINGPVLSGDETVLTHDDIRKGLVDRNNKPIRTGLNKLLNFAFGGLGRASKLAWKVGKAVNKAAVDAVKGGWALGKRAVKSGIAVAGGTLDLLRLRNPFRQGRASSLDEQTVQVAAESKSLLEEIRDLLRDRLPERKKKVAGDIDGDGVREGSYADLMADKAQRDKEAAEQAAQGGSPDETKKSGFFASLLAKLRGKKDEEDDDEGGDTNIELGGGDNSRDARRKRRLARRPGGSWRTSRGFGGKAKFLGRQGLGLLKGAGRFGLGLLGTGLGVGSMLSGAGAAVAGAGSAIAAGATAVGGALATAGAAIAGVISAPVLIGAAAVAAIGVGAYYGYKYLTKKRLGLLSRIRYAQYGFMPTDEEHLNAVFGLEDKLKEMVVYGKEGATLDGKRAKPEELIKDFGLDSEDNPGIRRWLRWFTGRFKPVFLTHVSALKAIAGDKWLSDVDGLDAPVALKYMNATRYPEGPYNETTSPFKDLDALKAGKGDVEMLVNIAETELSKKAKASTGQVVAAGAAGVMAAKGMSTAPNSSPQVGGTPNTGVSKNVLSTAAATAALPAATPTGAQVGVSGSSVVLTSLRNDRLDGVDVVRMKAYGLVKMEADKVKALMALEAKAQETISYSKNVASWIGSLEYIVGQCSPAFGVDITNDGMVANWLNWFNTRFLPVYLNYATMVKAQTGRDDPAEGKPLLKAGQMVDLATGLYTTSGSAGSVWSVGVSPWVGYELNADVRSTEANMQGLKDMAKGAVLVEPGGKNSNQPTAQKSAANTPFSSSLKVGDLLGGVASAGAAVGSAVSWGWDKVKQAVGIGSGPSSLEGGRQMEHPGKGTGGDVNAIPMPKGNKSWAAVKDTILGAAKMVGVDGKLMAAMAAIESGFNHAVSAGTSSATGLFQFIKSTWDWMLKRFGPKYGIAPGTPATDPRANSLMGAEYIKMNLEALQGSIGRPVTDTDIYMAHFLGSGGAKKFLKADPNAIAATFMQKEAQANRPIFYNGDGTPRTVGQIYQLMNNKLQTRAKQMGVSFDGGEAIVSKPAEPVKGDAPPATATKGTSKSTPASKSAYGMGANVGGEATTATTAPASEAKAPATPVDRGAAVTGAGGGFSAPRPLRDQVSALKQMEEIRVSNLATCEGHLKESVDLQGKMLEALQNIEKKVGGLSVASTAPTSQNARNTERRVSDLPPAPISVSRPRPAF